MGRERERMKVVAIVLFAALVCCALGAPTTSMNSEGHKFSLKKHRQVTVNTNLVPDLQAKREEPAIGSTPVVVAVQPTNSTSFQLSACQGDPRGTGMCNMDQTHRVCATIKNTDFFAVTGMTNFETRIGMQGFWCIPMFAMDRYVASKSCEGIEIDCNATDSRLCSGRDTSPLNRAPTTAIPHARECFAAKCPGRC